MFLFIAFLIFSAALGSAAYYIWSVPRQRMHGALAGRLRELRTVGGQHARASNDLIRREQRGGLAALWEGLAWAGPLRRLQEYIDQAKIKRRATEVVGACLAIGIVVWLACGLLGLRLFVFRAGLAAGLGALPLAYVVQVRKRRLSKFEEGLPDAIDLFNRSMKAGHNIHAGLASIAQESFDPVREEFRKVIEELALGAPLEETLYGLGRRVPLIDLRFFVIGLILQRQTGADLAQVLENLALLVRERLTLAAKMKAATAQQRLSARLLCSLPLVVALGFWFVKPEYIRLLFVDATGKKFLTYAVISEIIGIFAIRKIANPRF